MDVDIDPSDSSLYLLVQKAAVFQNLGQLQPTQQLQKQSKRKRNIPTVGNNMNNNKYLKSYFQIDKFDISGPIRNAFIVKLDEALTLKKQKSTNDTNNQQKTHVCLICFSNEEDPNKSLLRITKGNEDNATKHLKTIHNITKNDELSISTRYDMLNNIADLKEYMIHRDEDNVSNLNANDLFQRHCSNAEIELGLSFGSLRKSKFIMKAFKCYHHDNNVIVLPPNRRCSMKYSLELYESLRQKIKNELIKTKEYLIPFGATKIASVQHDVVSLFPKSYIGGMISFITVQWEKKCIPFPLSLKRSGSCEEIIANALKQYVDLEEVFHIMSDNAPHALSISSNLMALCENESNINYQKNINEIESSMNNENCFQEVDTSDQIDEAHKIYSNDEGVIEELNDEDISSLAEFSNQDDDSDYVDDVGDDDNNHNSIENNNKTSTSMDCATRETKPGCFSHLLNLCCMYSFGDRSSTRKNKNNGINHIPPGHDEAKELVIKIIKVNELASQQRIQEKINDVVKVINFNGRVYAGRSVNITRWDGIYYCVKAFVQMHNVWNQVEELNDLIESINIFNSHVLFAFIKELKEVSKVTQCRDIPISSWYGPLCISLLHRFGLNISKQGLFTPYSKIINIQNYTFREEYLVDQGKSIFVVNNKQMSVNQMKKFGMDLYNNILLHLSFRFLPRDNSCTVPLLYIYCTVSHPYAKEFASAMIGDTSAKQPIEYLKDALKKYLPNYQSNLTTKPNNYPQLQPSFINRIREDDEIHLFISFKPETREYDTSATLHGVLDSIMHTNVLGFWRECDKFNTVKALNMILLATDVSSAATEGLFSTLKHIINSKRTNLNPNMLSTVVISKYLLNDII